MGCTPFRGKRLPHLTGEAKEINILVEEFLGWAEK
jgi:hypothetical protein